MIGLKVKNESIKKNTKLNLEEDISLEEIAKIVEENIHILGDDLLKYDGYDIPEDAVEYDTSEAVEIYDMPKNEEKSRAEKSTNKRDKGINNKEKNNREKKNQDINKKEINNKETKNKETKNKETSNKEINNKEINNKETNKNEIKRNNDFKKEKVSRVNRDSQGFDFVKRRYTTLEVMMGIAVISLIFSSGIGVVAEIPDFMLFSKWNGITFGDLGLPLLLFSICFMIPTEIELDVKKKKSFKEIIIKKLKIGAALFLIGIIINLIKAWNFSNFRVMGILQMIAVVYTVGSLVYILFKKFNFKISVIAVFLTVIGVIGLGGYYFIAAEFGNTMKTCLAYFVDSKVMPGHFGDFERYGIIATVSAIFSGLLAIAGGSFLCNRRVENRDKSNRILIMGMFFVIIALIMEKNCPYNSGVLSPSFMMIVLGGYFIVFAAMFGIFDLNSNKISRNLSYPFVILGSSAVFVIGLNEFIKATLFNINVYSIAKGCSMKLDEWLVIDMFSEILGNGAREIGLLIAYLLIIFALMLYLYAKKIFVRFK